MYRALVFFALVTISSVIGNPTKCPTGDRPATLEGTYKVVSKHGELGFLGGDCATLVITKTDNNFHGVVTFKKDKKADEVRFTMRKPMESLEAYEIKRNDKDEAEKGHFVFAYSTAKTHALVGCSMDGENRPKFNAFVIGETTTQINDEIRRKLAEAAYNLDYSKFTVVEHSDAKCKSNECTCEKCECNKGCTTKKPEADNGATFLIPSILTGIIMMLVTKLL